MIEKDMPIYMVVWEYDRSNFIFAQHGVKKMLAVFKCDFSQVGEIAGRFGNSSGRPIMFDYWAREPDTNFLRENAKEWKSS